MDIKVFIQKSAIYASIFGALLGLFTFVHLSVQNTAVFLITMSVVIVTGIIATYWYNRYEIQKERAVAEQRLSEFKQQLASYAVLDSMRNAVFGQAHDLKNPLKAIKAFTRDLQKVVPPDTPKADRFFEIIDRNVELLSRELDSMLNHINRYFQEMNTDYATEFEAEQVSYTLREAIDQALGNIGDILHRERIEVRVEVSETIQPNYISKTMMVSIVTNLLTNAITALQTKRTRIVRVTSEDLNEGYFLFRFTDNGDGIPQDVIPHLFEFGYSASGSTGYGLASVKMAITPEPVCGDIWVDSSSEGTTFTLKLRKRSLPSPVGEIPAVQAVH